MELQLNDIHIIHNLEEVYKVAKNKCNKLVRKSKGRTFNNYINKNINCPEELWKWLKRCGVVDGQERGSNFPEPNMINTFFVSNNNAVVDQQEINDECFRILESCIYPSFVIQHASELEVLKIIKGIKTKSMGVDDITVDMLNKSVHYCLYPLTHIINYSISHNEFPDLWKKANVTPIPKLNNPSSCKDFRPISLLCIISKILEKIISKQVITYLTDLNLLNPVQSGYRADHSTATALLKVITDIIDGLDRNDVAILALLDYSKAFDTVNHRLVLAKLKALGFMSEALSWFSSYLSGRCQRVKQDRNFSGWLDVENGVPQGSILGPLLFIVTSINIKDAIVSAEHHMYADDTQVYMTSSLSNLPSNVELFNSDLNSIEKWSKKNALKLNPQKCSYMFIGSRHNLNKIAESSLPLLKIGDTPLPQVDRCKNLGVIFDSHFNWESHINKLVSHSYLKLKSIYRFKHLLSPQLKLNLCDSLVLSSFNYCDILFSNIGKAHQAKIQQVQNSCLRFAFNVRKYDHITPYLQSSKWLNMKDRRVMHSLCMIYKILNNLTPQYLLDPINMLRIPHNYSTRQLNLLPIPPFRKSLKENSFYVKMVNTYNSLSEDIKLSTSLHIFKRKLRQFLVT